MSDCEKCSATPGWVFIDGALWRCSCPLGEEAKLFADKKKERPIHVRRLPATHPSALVGRDRATGEKEDE